MAQLDDLPPLREVIRKYDLTPKKSLGQNFLFDLNLTARIARAAEPLENITVVEVGPGPGGLTREVLWNGNREALWWRLEHGALLQSSAIRVQSMRLQRSPPGIPGASISLRAMRLRSTRASSLVPNVLGSLQIFLTILQRLFLSDGSPPSHGRHGGESNATTESTRRHCHCG